MIKNIDQMKEENTRVYTLFKKWQKALETLAEESAAEKPDAAVREQCVTQLAGWLEYFPDFRESLNELRLGIAKSYQIYVQKYEALLREECERLGYIVQGEFPSLAVDGLIRIRLDKEENTAIINNKKTPSLSLRTVIERIKDEHKRLWERPVDLKQFANQLKNAYKTVCQEKHVREGDYLALREIYQHLRTTEKNYPQDLFAADISRLLENGSLLNTFDIAPVRDPNKAIYIYDRKSHNSRYIGLIRFR